MHLKSVFNDSIKCKHSSIKDTICEVMKTEDDSVLYSQYGSDIECHNNWPPGENVTLKFIVPISQPKHMLWVLKENVLYICHPVTG